MGAIEPRTFLDRPRQLCHVAGNDSVHAGLAHGLVTKLIAVGRAASPENRPALKSSFPKVFGNRLGCGEMDADGAVAVAFLVASQRGLIACVTPFPPSKEPIHRRRTLASPPDVGSSTGTLWRKY